MNELAIALGRPGHWIWRAGACSTVQDSALFATTRLAAERSLSDWTFPFGGSRRVAVGLPGATILPLGNLAPF